VEKQVKKRAAHKTRRTLIVGLLAIVLAALGWFFWGREKPMVEQPSVAHQTVQDNNRTFPEPTGDPQRLKLPAVSIDAAMTSVGLPADGVLNPPFDVAAWYNEGPRPGFAGPSVIVGHVDSRNGPNVFWDLHKVKVGDEVLVEYPSQAVTFVVTSTQTVPRNDLPTQQIWNKTDDQVLRLVTCIGEFSHTTREYSDNFIVYAKESGVLNR